MQCALTPSSCTCMFLQPTDGTGNPSTSLVLLPTDVPATSSTTPSPPHHTSSPLHQSESDSSASVILIGTSLGLGSVMVVIAVIIICISVTVPVCVVKRARQQGEVTLDSKATRGLVTSCHMTVTHVVHVM